MPHDDDRTVVAHPRVVAEQHARDERRVAPGEARVVGQRPMAAETVGMEHERRFARPWVFELLYARQVVAERAEVGDEMPLALLGEDPSDDVADPAVANDFLGGN